MTIGLRGQLRIQHDRRRQHVTQRIGFIAEQVLSFSQAHISGESDTGYKTRLVRTHTHTKKSIPVHINLRESLGGKVFFFPSCMCVRLSFFFCVDYLSTPVLLIVRTFRLFYTNFLIEF